MTEPAPIATTSNSLFTGELAAMGAMMALAKVMATVAEPTAMRMAAATSQPSSNGESCMVLARSEMASSTPLTSSTLPKPPPAPTTRKMVAQGPTQSSVNLSSWVRLKPHCEPNDHKASSTARSIATSGEPRKSAHSRKASPLGSVTSAMVAPSISNTGSVMVNRVMAKPGRRDRVEFSWHSFSPMPPSGTCMRWAISLANIGPATAAHGRPMTSDQTMVLPTSAPTFSMATIGPGCGGTSPWEVARPAMTGMPK